MVHDDRTTEQEIASGRPAWTPSALIGSVIGVIALLFGFALVLAVLAYVLA